MRAPDTQAPPHKAPTLAWWSMALDREAVLRRELAMVLHELEAVREELASRVAAAAAELQATKAEQRARVDRLSQDLREREQDVRERERAIAAIYASRSWKLAAPARAVSRVARRLCTRCPYMPEPSSPDTAAERPTQPTAAPSAPAGQPPRRRGRGVILVAAAAPPPRHPWDGSGLRLQALMASMSEAGWSVAFGCLGEDARSAEASATRDRRAHLEAALREIGIERILCGLDEISAYLVEVGRDLHWAYLLHSAVAVSLLPLVRSRGPMVRIVYEPGEFDDPKTGPDAIGGDELAPSTQGRRPGAIDVACARGADVTIVETRKAQAVLLAIAHDVVVERLPAVFVAPRDSPPGPAGREGLLFAGRFQDRPSLEAIVWFVDRIWPLIRLEAPDLALCIAGLGAEDERSALSDRPGIEVLGSISDLAQLYDRHRVLIAPFRSPGAGMRDEVGRSLAHGLPVVATSIGSGGMELEDGVHILVADQEEAFAGHVLQVLRDDALWLRLSRRGRAQVETTMSVNAFRTRLDEVLGG